MSIEELCALPVADLAAEDSALFLFYGFLPRQGRVVFSPLRSENLHPALDTPLVRREN